MKTKNSFGFYAALFTATMCSFSANAQDKNITITGLPANAQAFIKQHFKGQTVTSAHEDKEMFETDYNAVLSNGIEIEFDNKGNWDEIDGNHIALPTSVLPKAIADYTAANYKAQGVVQIDKKRSGYDIELANGTELEFDANGKFLRIDD
jgi:hypothetical protein